LKLQGERKLPSKVKEVKSIKGTPGRESYRKQIVQVLAEGGASMPLQELPGLLRDIKELENQGLINIDDMKMVAPKRANLTEKGKSHVIYEKTESEETP
jgi:hypothetical protein